MPDRAEAGVRVANEVLSIRGVSKRYGRHLVLDDVGFDLAAGETAAVVGENGAGKSTLARILAGATRPDAGELRIDGRPVSFGSPRAALAEGIAFIPQELVYVPRLSVAENICLGRWPRRAGFTARAAIRRRAAAEARRFGIDLPLDVEMARLSLAQQQLVEILRAFARQSRIILLDEPTAALGGEDAERLLELLGGLAGEGVGVLYISHRLDEVFRTCTSAHVLRNGRLVRSGPVAGTRPAELITAMLGREMTDAPVTRVAAGRTPAAVVGDWSRTASPALHDVSVSVGEGEIVGLYGVRGSGTETVAEGLGGLHADIGGRLELNGRPVGVPTGPLAARRAAIAYVPADRKSQGLVLSQAVQPSLAMMVWGRLSRFGFVRGREERRHAVELSRRFVVNARSVRQPVGQLSGGNQQKVMVASRVAARPRLLVLQEPTRGVDVGARLELHRIVRKLAADGVAVLLVSSDIEEAVTLSDRLLVMREGRIVHEITAPGLDSQSEALHAAGGLE
jgi:ABC-type sugar transport system ATPase subunit